MHWYAKFLNDSYAFLNQKAIAYRLMQLLFLNENWVKYVDISTKNFFFTINTQFFLNWIRTNLQTYANLVLTINTHF